MGTVAGRATFEWSLDGRFLLQRSRMDHPAAPDSLAILALDGGAYRQHYFDSRGVVRLYAMTLDEGGWTLRRETADFSELGFRQRYTGTFEDGGRTLRGRWERAGAGEAWALDFEVDHTRADGLEP
jgi:hypothetical protein